MYCCNSDPTVYTPENACCSNTSVVLDSSNRLRCCGSSPVDLATYTWAITQGTTNSYSCCQNTFVTNGGGAKYCCGATGNTWTADTPCCPSTQVILDDTNTPRCCGFVASQTTHQWAKLSGTSNYQCCPVANVTVSTASVKTCCTPGTNWTNDNVN